MEMPRLWPMLGSHSVSTLGVHPVWSTAARQPTLAPDVDQPLSEFLASKARELGCRAMAVGNADDHLHIVVQYPSTLAVAELARRLKGASSRQAHVMTWMSTPLRWQAGYWAESIGAHQLDPLCQYVPTQRSRHASPTEPAEPWQHAPDPHE
jgi:REP element-mobilizing transposase RayT